MKKIFYFIASAIVALGAVACQNDIEENIDNKEQTEGVSIKVTIADQTRVTLGELNDENQRKLTFTEGDVLVVRSGYTEGTNYLFKYTKGEGDVYTFTCEAEGVNSLVGTNPEVFYLGGLHEQADDLVAFGAVCNTAAENISGIGMYCISDTGSFGDDDYTITLCTFPLLKFTANEPVTFSSDSNIFFNNGWEKNHTTTTTGEIYLPIMTSNGNECTVTVTTESGFNKSFKKCLVENTIYNLGTIAAPAKAYLVPNDNWKADNAWFAAYFFNEEAASVAATRSGATSAWVKMTDENADGIYECLIPEGFADAKVIFCRMNPAHTDFSWDEGHVWNQTADLTVSTESENNHCYIYDWGHSEWSDATTDPFVSTPGNEAEWSVAGDFNSWAEAANVMETTDTYALYVAKDIELDAGEEFKIKDKTTWDISYGRGIAHLNPNHYMAVVLGSQDNLSVAAKGTYDIYFNSLYSLVYLVEAGGDYTQATWQEKDGELEQSQPEDVTPGEQSEWALLGAFSSWEDQYFTTTTTAGVVVLEDVEMKAAEGFLVRKPSTEWADKYGAGNVNYLQTNHYITTANNGADMCLEADGTYDIYFDANTKNIYIMTAGTDYTTATEQTVSGKEPEVEEPEVTANILYLKPNSNWTSDNARFAAYFFNKSGTWVSMTDSDSDGVYEVNIPTGYTFGENVIFCRMNPSTTANNWNNKWNQTSDLVIPTDGKNCYTVQDGTWDNGDGTWSTK